jgi:alpha-galactosidase
MRDALHAAGRPIVFSLCEWGNSKPWEWGKNIGHLWRTTGDIYHCFDCKKDNGGWFSLGMLQILDLQDGLRKYAGPDHWNDPDMMEVGNGMSVAEDRAHFTMWCMLAAPLMAGNDLAAMTKETKEILTNKEVVAIDQDALGVQGLKFMTADSVETWFKPLQNGDWAMCFLNRTKVAKKIEFDWAKQIVVDDMSQRSASFDKIPYRIRNLWTKKESGTTKTKLMTEVPAHDVLLFRLIK